MSNIFNEEQWNNVKIAAKYFGMFSISLIFFELLLRANMTGGINRRFLFFLCFVPAQSLFCIVLSGLFKKKYNVLWFDVILAVLTIYYIAQFIYYKNFGSLFSASMIGMGGEAMTNFGWTLKEVLKANWGTILLFLVPLVVNTMLGMYGVVKYRAIKLRPRMIILAMIIPVWVMGISVTRIGGTGRQTAYAVIFDEMSGTDNTALHLGALTTTILEYTTGNLKVASSGSAQLVQVDENALLNQSQNQGKSPNSSPENLQEKDSNSKENTSSFKGKPQVRGDIDFGTLSVAASGESEEIQNLTNYLNTRSVSTTNEYTGIFEGYNLIYICAEAFWTYAVDEEITPTLYKMANKGVVLNNYYNSFKNTTTNGEFAFATSLWPDLSRIADQGTDVGSFYQSATCYMPVGLGDIFNELGVHSKAYHNYYGEYYRRILSWPNLGYDCKFLAHGLHFTTVWPSSDLELMEQTVDDYIGDDRFHAYYMTFSGHGPYAPSNWMYQKNADIIKGYIGEDKNQEVYGYLAGNYELDKAMEYLLERLEQAGKLDNTVIVIAGDHYPYNLSDRGREALVGFKMDTDFDIYKSTCIIYNAGLKENIVTDTYCCNVDILPTVLNLLGITYDSRLFMGKDIFSEGVHKAVLYNMSFITDLVRYNSATDECKWSEAASKMDENQRDKYIDNMINLINSEYAASLQIIKNNYYQFVWYNNGLMTDEEVKSEEKRVEKVEEKDEEINIMEAENATGVADEMLENWEENNN